MMHLRETDTVLNFERVYGSYHDDIVQFCMTYIVAIHRYMAMTFNRAINTRNC